MPCPVLWDGTGTLVLPGGLGLGLHTGVVLSFGMGLGPPCPNDGLGVGLSKVCDLTRVPRERPAKSEWRVLYALPRHMGGPAAEAHRMRLQSFEACVAPQQILDLRWPRFRRHHGNAGCFVALVMHHAFPVRETLYEEIAAANSRPLEMKGRS